MKRLLVIVLMFVAVSSNAQWSYIGTPVGGGDFYTFAHNSNTLFCSGMMTNPGIGIYASTNYGTNWSYRGLAGMYIKAIYANDNFVFAGGEDSGIYRSSNNGINWIKINNGLNTSNLHYVGPIISYNSFIFIGINSNDIYKSSNNGDLWVPSITGINSSGFWTFLINNSNLLLGTGNGVYLSTNNGNNWISTGPGMTVYSLANSGSVILAGTSGGLWKSTNGGFNWVYMYGQGNSHPILIENGNTIFSCSSTSGIIYTTNSGINWISKNEGLPSFNVITALHIMGPYIYTAVGINLSQIYRRTLQDILNVQQIGSLVPDNYSLEQNYPNPFNPRTTIKFQIANGFPIKTLGNDKVVLKVYDVMGREVETLVNERLQAGTYETNFDGAKYSSGVYFYNIQAGEFSETKRMLLIK